MAMRGCAAGLKGDGTIVTDADHAVDALLKARLLGAFPGYGWLSEESEDTPERLTRSHVWMVDPIDGTRAYAAATDDWAVSVALVVEGRPVLAVLAAPVRGVVYRATAGAGATANGSALRASTRERLEGARVPLDPGRERLGGVAVTRVVKPIALALRLTMVAADEADAVARRGAVRELDVAAAALIVAEAGGKISDARGRALVFNQPSAQFDGILASGAALHAAAIRALR